MTNDPGSVDALAELLDELVTLPTDAREARLRGIGEEHPAQAIELRELLAALPDPEVVSPDSRSLPDSDGYAGEPALGASIGGCVLRSVLGRGGVGTVYEADQADPPRRVAVKVIRAFGSRRSHVYRFRIEIAALARLEHPAIARIHVSGVERLGDEELPYLVMERVDDAANFVAWARRPARSTREVVERLVEVADGMQHGHARGVIHRDLKPSNVLVGADGRPKIIDFGIARILDGESGTGDETLAGALVGTPSYMAPEQLAPGPAAPDVRIDVHALGLILYEALSGRRAYEIPRERFFEAAQLMRDADPAPLERIDSRIGRDLSAVVAKAMAKDAARRYATMAEFAEDLRAVLDGRAVRARPESRAERSLRWVRRNPAWTVAAALVVTTLVASTVVTTTAWRRAAHQLALAQLARAAAAAEASNVRDSLELVEKAGIDADPRLVGFIVVPVDAEAGRYSDPSVVSHRMSGAMSPDRRTWIAGGDGPRVQIVDLEGGKVRDVALPASVENVWHVGFTADGGRMILGASDGVRELDPDGATRDRFLVDVGFIRGILPFSGLDRFLIFAGSRQLAVVDAVAGAAGPTLDLPKGNSIGAMCWDGARRAYATGADGRLRAFDLGDDGVPTVDPRFEPPDARGIGVALSPDGRLVAFGTTLGEFLLLDATTGAVVANANLRHSIWGIAFSPDGSRVFAGDRAGRVHRLRTPDLGDPETHVVRDSDPTWALGAIDSERVVANLGTTIRLFDFSPRWSTTPEAFPEGRMLGATPFDGRRMRAVGPSGTVHELDLSSGRWAQVGATPATAWGFRAAAIAADGTKVAGWNGQSLLIRSIDEAEGVEQSPGASDLHAVVRWSDDGSRVVLASDAGFSFFDRSGEPLATSARLGAPPQSLHWIGPRSVHATIFAGGVKGLTSTVSEDRAATLDERPSPTVTLLRSGDRWIAAGLEGSIFVGPPGPSGKVPTNSLELPIRLVGHDDTVRSVAVAPDGRWMASGGTDGRVRFWDLEREELHLTLRASDQAIAGLRWSTDGRSLLVFDVAGGLRYFDSVPRRERIAADAGR